MDAYPNPAVSINWRARLVPAAAVIPAPAVYTNTAAVKKLVVDCRVAGAVWLVASLAWMHLCIYHGSLRLG